MDPKYTDEYFKEKLTPEQYRVLREKGTEIPFTGELLNNKEEGIYRCAACGAEIFRSDDKFESHSGWPSFHDLISQDKVDIVEDHSHMMDRLEVKCKNCGSHLGHSFPGYGPEEHPKNYYCINSCALDFKPTDSTSTSAK